MIVHHVTILSNTRQFQQIRAERVEDGLGTEALGRASTGVSCSVLFIERARQSGSSSECHVASAHQATLQGSSIFSHVTQDVRGCVPVWPVVVYRSDAEISESAKEPKGRAQDCMVGCGLYMPGLASCHLNFPCLHGA